MLALLGGKFAVNSSSGFGVRFLRPADDVKDLSFVLPDSCSSAQMASWLKRRWPEMMLEMREEKGEERRRRRRREEKRREEKRRRRKGKGIGEETVSVNVSQCL